jgi:hypothetical protein
LSRDRVTHPDRRSDDRVSERRVVATLAIATAVAVVGAIALFGGPPFRLEEILDRGHDIGPTDPRALTRSANEASAMRAARKQIGDAAELRTVQREPGAIQLAGSTTNGLIIYAAVDYEHNVAVGRTTAKAPSPGPTP